MKSFAGDKHMKKFSEYTVRVFGLTCTRMNAEQLKEHDFTTRAEVYEHTNDGVWIWANKERDGRWVIYVETMDFQLDSLPCDSLALAAASLIEELAKQMKPLQRVYEKLFSKLCTT